MKSPLGLLVATLVLVSCASTDERAAPDAIYAVEPGDGDAGFGEPLAHVLDMVGVALGRLGELIRDAAPHELFQGNPTQLRLLFGKASQVVGQVNLDADHGNPSDRGGARFG